MSNINDSYNYAQSLGDAGQAKHGRLVGNIITGEALIGISHFLGNRRRVKMGLPPEPMSNAVAVPMAIGLGYVLWFVPFFIYMILATYVFHQNIIALAVTIGIFVFAFKQWKKKRQRKYSTYYIQKREAHVVDNPNLHAPGSDEWLAQATARMRKNILGQ